MRIRNLAVTFCLLLLGAAMVSLGAPGLVHAQDDATPVATPVAEEAEVPVDEAATPTVLETETDIITLVAWYGTDASGEFLVVGPLETDENLVAGPADPETGITGTVDFDAPENNDLPRIVLGDSILDAYPWAAGDPTQILRWLYFNGIDGLRPATLVFQVEATAGPYEGAVGTATFTSRGLPGSGTLVILLDPTPDQ
jgi:hypothetical protein